MSKNNTNKKENAFLRFFKTIGRWAGRAFFGGSRALSMDDALSVEKIESPSVMAVKTFFRRKLAVVALVVLISLFLLVFIGPLFIPMDLNHTDNLQANIAPTMSMRSVPKDLKNNIRNISGKSNFTLGVSNDNNLYIWGYTNDPLANIEYSEFPEEIKEGSTVKSGTVIGAIGETAMTECAEEPHLHFEIRLDNTKVNPHNYITVPSSSVKGDDYEG